MRASPVLLLAGGRGRRLGGIDKSALTLPDRPDSDLLQRAFERYQELGPVWAAVGPTARPHARPRQLLDPDEYAPYSGPMAGLLAGFRQRLSELGPGLLLSCPIDLLAPSPGFLHSLVDRLEATPGLALVRARQVNRIEPLVAAWRVDQTLLDSAQSALAAGHLAVHRWQGTLPCAELATPVQESHWHNLNSPADLAKLLAP